MTPTDHGHGASGLAGRSWDEQWDDLCRQVDDVVASVEHVRYRAVILGLAVAAGDADQVPLLADELTTATADHRRAAAMLDVLVARIADGYGVAGTEASLAVLAVRAPGAWRQRLIAGCRTIADEAAAASSDLGVASRAVAADELHVRQLVGDVLGTVDLRDEPGYGRSEHIGAGRLADGRA